jgi:hypothetical protein
MWQIGLNFPNSFALALPRRAILAFRSIPAVGARIVAIASIAADREPSAKCLRKNTRICHCARGRRGPLRRASLGHAPQLLGAPAQIQPLMAASSAAGSDCPALGICVPMQMSTLSIFCIR